MITLILPVITPECFLCLMLGFMACILLVFLALYFFFKVALPIYANQMSKVFQDEVLKTLGKKDDTK